MGQDKYWLERHLGPATVRGWLWSVLGVSALVWGSDLARRFPLDVQWLAQLEQIARILTPIAIGVGIWVAWRRAVAADRQAGAALRSVEAAQEGQITERFTRAVEQLGDESVSVRLGGIYALERISRDSERDHWTIMEVLSAYVRENAPSRGKADITLGADIKAVLKVLGRHRIEIYQDPHSREWDIDLRKVCLKGVEINGASLPRINLGGADLREANLDGSYFRGSLLSFADLRGASLSANLSQAYLHKADLSGARLVEAYLPKADFSGASLAGANLTGAILSGADLSGADLGGALLKGTHLSGFSFLKEGRPERPIADDRLDWGELSTEELLRSGADMSEANLNEANLSGADLSGVKGLTQEQINAAQGDINTTLPKNLERPAHWLKEE